MVFKAIKKGSGNILDPTSLKSLNFASILSNDRRNRCKKYAKIWGTAR